MRNSIYKPYFLIFSALLVSYVYAYFRYIVFGVFQAENMFLFISNKSVSLGAIMLIPFFIQNNSNIIKLAINILVIFHILLSLYILNPNYYPSLFDNLGIIYEYGIIVVAAGIVAALFFFNLISKQFIEIPIYYNTLFLLLSVLIHNIFIGQRTWRAWETWNGHMPPLSLISSLILIYSIGLLILKKAKIFKSS